MKRFLNPILLSCLVSMFVPSDLVIGQIFQRRSERAEPADAGREMRTPTQRQAPARVQSQQNNPITRGVTVEPTKPSPILGQVQPPIQSPSPAPQRVQLPSQHFTPQIQTLTLHQYQVHRGFGQRLRLGVGAEEYRGEGVLVTHVLENSPGHISGLVAGDVILEINRMPINDLMDYSYAVDRSSETMSVKVENNGQESMITIELRY